MKTHPLKYAILLFFILFTSCDRSGIFEEFKQSTPWELHVAVYSDENMTSPVSGADIFIFKTEEDRDNNTNAFLSKKSDEKGEAVFTLAEFDSSSDPQKAKGIYYLKVAKGGTEVNDLTRYLLMNDGHTYHNIVLQ